MSKRYTGINPQQQQAQIKKKLSELPTRIGKMGVDHFKHNFETESWEGEKWKPRSGNAPGSGRKLLRQSSTLYRAIDKFVQANRIRVFIKAPADVYGKIQNEGGITHPRVTAKSKKFAWAMYYKTKRPMWKAMALGEAGSSRTVKIPKRQFIGASRKMDMKAHELVTKTINEILNP